MAMDEGCWLETDRNSLDVDAVIDALVAACDGIDQSTIYLSKLEAQHSDLMKFVTVTRDPEARDPVELEDLEPEEGIT